MCPVPSCMKDYREKHITSEKGKHLGHEGNFPSLSHITNLTLTFKED